MISRNGQTHFKNITAFAWSPIANAEAIKGIGLSQVYLNLQSEQKQLSGGYN